MPTMVRVFRPIRSRQLSAQRRPSTKEELRISRSVLLLILAFLCILAGVVLIIVGSNPDKEDEREVIAGGVVVGLGLCFTVGAILLYRNARKQQAAKQQARDARIQSSLPRSNIETIEDGAISEEPTLDTTLSDDGPYGNPAAAYPVAYNGTVYNSTHDLSNSSWSDHGEIQNNSNNWNASTMKLSEQEMRKRHTPPSPEPGDYNDEYGGVQGRRADDDPMDIYVIDYDGSDYDGTDAPVYNGGIDYSDILSDVTSFRSARDDLASDDTGSYRDQDAFSTPPESRGQRSRRSVHFEDGEPGYGPESYDNGNFQMVPSAHR